MADLTTDNQIPAGFVKIPSSLGTAELQQAQFDEIQPVGTVGQPGSFLIGRPKGGVAIPGAIFNTSESQNTAFGNIRQVGQTGEAGSFLVGTPKAERVTLADGRTYSIDPLSGNATLVTEQPDAGGTGVTGPTSADVIKQFAQSPNSPQSIADLIASFETGNAALQKQILDAMKPSAREDELQKQIDDLTNRTKSGLLNIEGRPIPIEDIGGEQERLVKNTTLILQPLIDELTRSQTSRKGTADTLTAALGFQQQGQQLKLKAAELIQQPFIEADKQVRGFLLDLALKYPDAGITVEDTAESASQKVAQSNSFLKAMFEDQRTTGIKEYQFATQQGFTGSFLDFERAKTEIAAGSKGELVFDGAGNPFVWNPATRTLEPYSAAVGVGSGGSSGLPRTTRHNNLIAAAVPKGGTNAYTNALSNAGIRWSYGDAFPDDPTMTTIRIEGDPYEASRAILSNSPALQDWYVNHTGKDIPTRYGVSNNAQFKAAPIAVQNAIIEDIYRAENGTDAPAPINAFVPKTGTVSKAADLRIADAKADFASVDQIVRQIGGLADQIFSATTPAEAAWQFIDLNTGALTGFNEQAKLYKAAVDGLLSLLVRGLGEKGTLTDKDINRIRPLVPGFGDTKSVAKQKILQLNQLLTEIRDQKIAAYEALKSGGGSEPETVDEALNYINTLGL